MTSDETFVEDAMRPSNGWDRNKAFSFELARVVAERLMADGSLIEEGRRYLDRHMRDDPGQQRYYRLWSKLLDLGPEAIASRLLADSAEGALLRDTRPVFYVVSGAERDAALARARARVPR